MVATRNQAASSTRLSEAFGLTPAIPATIALAVFGDSLRRWDSRWYAPSRTDASDADAASTFFKCASGYQFQINANSAARCFKRATYKYKSLKRCPRIGNVGYGLVRDYKRGSREDFCVTQMPGNAGVQATLPTACPPGYKKQLRSKSQGPDRCFKRIGAKVAPPTVATRR